MEIRDKNILIIGNARSGQGAAKLALALGAKVYIYDGKAYEKWNEESRCQIDEMKKQGILFALGKSIDTSKFDLIVISPGVPPEIEIVQAAIKQGKIVTGEFEFASWFCKAPIIAITGTNGKTTTTTLVGEIVSKYNPRTYIVGNIGRAFSEDVLSIPEDGAVVAEVSSFQLETADTFKPQVSALLNITPDHLNRHHTMENYCACKYNIFKNQEASEFSILNTRDSYYKEAKSHLKAQGIDFSITRIPNRGAYLKGDLLCENIHSNERVICGINELLIKGTHNVENALAAIAITTAFGVPSNLIREVLTQFKGVEHRTEFVTTKNGIDFFNDSKATNTDAAIAGLVGLSSLKKPIRLIAGGMDKQTTFKEWIRLFDGRVVKVYVIGETKEQIIRECKEEGYNSIECFSTLEEAVSNAYREGQSGECILLSPACASWDMFESYEQRGRLFKQIVNNLEG